MTKIFYFYFYERLDSLRSFHKSERTWTILLWIFDSIFSLFTHTLDFRGKKINGVKRWNRFQWAKDMLFPSLCFSNSGNNKFINLFSLNLNRIRIFSRYYNLYSRSIASMESFLWNDIFPSNTIKACYTFMRDYPVNFQSSRGERAILSFLPLFRNSLEINRSLEQKRWVN